MRPNREAFRAFLQSRPSQKTGVMGVTGVMVLFINDLADHTAFVTSVMGVMEIAGRFLVLPPARTAAPVDAQASA